MNRDYKRLACFHAAQILDDALINGCLFAVAENWADADGAEVTVIEGIAEGMQELADELERRGSNAPTARPKRKREPAVWRETTDLERRAIAAYRTCYTPPYSFDRRLSRQIRYDKITDRQAAWLWFYIHKHRKQIADVEVVREAERSKAKTA